MHTSERDRWNALIEAEGRGMALLDRIEALGLIQPSRSERDVEQDIYALAAREFGVEAHWHKRIVRAGPNTVCVFAENPPIREIEPDDTVFIDIGPVFEDWEADVGRTYALGDDPEKQRLCRDLPRIFDALQAHAAAHPDITGAELYAEAHRLAEAAGWLFGGQIAGHIVGEFPHARLPGDKDHYRISAANPTRLAEPDATGQRPFWIIEVHLVDPTHSWGGFYERLMVPTGLG
jgi:Xaa-Pro aminopeptidase